VYVLDTRENNEYKHNFHWQASMVEKIKL